MKKKKKECGCGYVVKTKMAESTFAWLSVVVKRGHTTLLPRKITKIAWENNFGQLLSVADPALAEQTIAKVCISSNHNFFDPVHQVDVTAPLSVCSTFKCLFVCFHLQEDDAKKKHLFNSSKVRGVIHCQECFKPRCVYSSQKLQWNERVLLKDVTNEKLYTYGSSLFITDSLVVETIVVRQNIGCRNPMESQYYSAKLLSFPPVCYYCGVMEEFFY